MYVCMYIYIYIYIYMMFCIEKQYTWYSSSTVLRVDTEARLVIQLFARAIECSLRASFRRHMPANTEPLTHNHPTVEATDTPKRETGRR